MNELPTSIDRNKATPWGFWATISFSSIVIVTFLIIEIVVAVTFVLFTKAQNPQIDIENFSRSLSSNGFFLAIATIISASICTPLTLLFTKLRRNFPINDYLGLMKPTKRELVRWLLFLGIFIVSSDVLTHILNRPIVPAFMVDAYKTAHFTPALYVALLFTAPIFEEIFFRGFLFQGIKYSWLGSMGAVGLTALGW